MSFKMNIIISSLIALLSLTSMINAQETMVDVVYLQNGSIIRGTIIEFVPDSLVKIQTTGGSVFVYQMSEVLKITKEPIKIEQKIYKIKEENPFSFGLKGGVNFASWKVSGEGTLEDFSGRTCLGAGFFVTQYNSPLSLRLEFMYFTKGAKETIEELYTDITYKIETISLIPFIVIGTNDPSSVNIFLEVGPELGVIISKKGEYDIFGTKDEENLENFSSFEWAINLGIGFIIDNTLIIDARYSLGLTDLIDDIEEEVEARSRGIQIMAGFLF